MQLQQFATDAISPHCDLSVSSRFDLPREKELPAKSQVAVAHTELPSLHGLAQLAVEGSQVLPKFLVPHGLGALVGLSPLQHVDFSLALKHPAGSLQVLDSDLQEAINFECAHTVEDIHNFRQQQLQKVLQAVDQLHAERMQWTQDSPAEVQLLTSRIHGPLWRCLLAMAGVEAGSFLRDLQLGFPLVGELPPCEGSSKSEVFKAGMTVQQLRQNRVALNQNVLAAVKELPFSEDISPQVYDDFFLGAMTVPRLLTPSDVESVTLTRRIPVRELRAKGWRTRVVDHESESGVNLATLPCDRIQHDTLDTLAAIVFNFFHHDSNVRMWKRDVSKAFRRVPIRSSHLEFSWSVWSDQGVLWTAQHKGMPFGTVSAVYAWHRVGHMLRTLVLRIFKAPVARYVDDFFGASKLGVVYTGGWLLTVLAGLLGFPTDPEKDSDNAESMVVLGSLCRVDFRGRSLRTHVEPSKAAKYAQLLQTVLDTNLLEPGQASKMAGRLSFAVTVSGNRVGRAYIKPFYAQAHAPLPGHVVSPWLRRSAEWFIRYLKQPPVSVRRGCGNDRPCVVSWSDAAGESTWVAAVICVTGTFFWTRLQTPPEILKLLLDRGDHQIGFQELLGIILVWGTFEHLLQGALWLAFVDNDGVLHALTKGGGGGPESFACIGKLWLELAYGQTDLHCGRVESAANIADGPTREQFDLLGQLKATWVPPILPPWVQRMWSYAG